MHENLEWCPIDVPRFPYPDMDMEVASDYWAWTFKRLTSDNLLSKVAVGLTKEIDDRYPLLAGWLTNFPAVSIRNIKFNIQKDIVDPHVDFGNPKKDPDLYENNRQNEPCGYRVLIKGKRSDGLYIKQGEHRIHARMPDDTDTYVLGQTCTEHGVEHDPGRKTMFLHFEIEPLAQATLIARSLARYGDRAIWRQA